MSVSRFYLQISKIANGNYGRRSRIVSTIFVKDPIFGSFIFEGILGIELLFGT